MARQHDQDPGVAESDVQIEERDLTPSTKKLMRIMGPNPKPRMLSPYEQQLLRQSKREIIERIRQIRSEDVSDSFTDGAGAAPACLLPSRLD